MKAEETTMKAPIIAAALAAIGMSAIAQPAHACSAGYESVWIQGHKICKIKTPKLGLKANTGPSLNKSAAFKARSAPPRRTVR